MAKKLLLRSWGVQELAHDDELTLEQNGIPVWVTEEHDHGIIYHLRVEGKRNYKRACKLLGIADDSPVSITITREAYEEITAALEHRPDLDVSELLIIAVRGAQFWDND